ncbi:MAG: Rrf2 family transcriptional regulator [Ruminiclostridium sp.]|nr:Rrf2 family transcriptional regulator [Ruminiclostridium sp.]
MKISTKVECGLISLIDICVHSGSSVVTVVNISARQHISAKYLEQILQQLRHADIIKSVKGSHGGYMLNRRAEEITLSDIINALDSTVLGEVKFESMDESAAMNALSECVWDRITRHLQSFTDGITLRELADKYGSLKVQTEEPMYYI